jgi:hypothetical protein
MPSGSFRGLRGGKKPECRKLDTWENEPDYQKGIQISTQKMESYDII